MHNRTGITFEPNVMVEESCKRGIRVTAATFVGLAAFGNTNAEILEASSYFDEDDMRGALLYAAWRVKRIRRHEHMPDEGALITVDESRSRVRILPI